MRAAAKDVFELAAEVIVDLAEKLLAGVEPAQQKVAAHLDAAHQRFVAALALRAGNNAGVDHFHGQRHRGELVRMVILNVPVNVPQVRADKAPLGTAKAGKEAGHPRIGVVQRKERDRMPAGKGAHGGIHIRHDVFIREHYALGLARGAGGIYDREQVLGVYFRGKERFLILRAQRFAFGKHAADFGDREKVFYRAPGGGLYRLRFMRVFFRIEQRVAFAVFKLVYDLGRFQPHIHRNHHETARGDRVEDHVPHIGVFA